MRNRYKVIKPVGHTAIRDGENYRLFAFGPGFDFSHVPYQQHRASYTEVNAVHVTEWLNERVAGYPTGPRLFGVNADGAIVRVGE